MIHLYDINTENNKNNRAIYKRILFVKYVLVTMLFLS
ncbi:hypothetical protein MNBD_GAMMA22-2667 [hydrothermal vent metagenome]|uniref:Uncharacterized protein n=1 Tax=hydrothermal vent metagenome TaxID=652676 RepID=A0A3B0ZPS2_9ZZZZ